MSYRCREYWTRRRVVERLRAYYRTYGQTVMSYNAWHHLHRYSGQMAQRQYPSGYAILRHFRSMRAAWTAAGVVVDRSHEDWSESDDWYLREAIGLLKRTEIAEDLRRSPDAVHRRAYDLGLNARDRHGWSLRRTERALHTSARRLLTLEINTGRLPAIRGTQSCFLQPADLACIEWLNWDKATPEIVREAKRGLIARIVGLLEQRLGVA